MNVFSFTGNIGGDAVTRYTQSGTAVASFSVAVKSGYGKNEQTHWIGCNLWGKRAEGGLVQYLTKGQQVAVTGELSTREYDRKDGTKGFTVEVNVADVTLVGGRDNVQPQQQVQQQAPADEFDAEIPFAPIGLQHRNHLHMV